MWIKVPVDGSTAYVREQPDEFGRHLGEMKHTDEPVIAVWDEEKQSWLNEYAEKEEENNA